MHKKLDHSRIHGLGLLVSQLRLEGVCVAHRSSNSETSAFVATVQGVLSAPACETLAFQDFAANVPVKENEFMVYGEDFLDLGGSNPPLQILQPILEALGRVVRERSMIRNAFTSHPSAAAKQRFSKPKPNLTRPNVQRPTIRHPAQMGT